MNEDIENTPQSPKKDNALRNIMITLGSILGFIVLVDVALIASMPDGNGIVVLIILGFSIFYGIPGLCILSALGFLIAGMKKEAGILTIVGFVGGIIGLSVCG